MKGKRRRAWQHVARAVAILNVGGVDDDAQQKAERVDEDMALAAGDFLARIIALRVERGAPFCAALALWLSMIAAVGLASRPSCSRVTDIERMVDALQRAVPIPQHEVECAVLFGGRSFGSACHWQPVEST